MKVESSYLPEYGVVDVAAAVEAEGRLQPNHGRHVLCKTGLKINKAIYKE